MNVGVSASVVNSLRFMKKNDSLVHPKNMVSVTIGHTEPTKHQTTDFSEQYIGQILGMMQRKYTKERIFEDMCLSIGYPEYCQLYEIAKSRL